MFRWWFQKVVTVVKLTLLLVAVVVALEESQMWLKRPWHQQLAPDLNAGPGPVSRRRPSGLSLAWCGYSGPSSPKLDRAWQPPRFAASTRLYFF